MAQIKLHDFFEYYENTNNQWDAVALLESQMPSSLLNDGAAWVNIYREQPDEPVGPLNYIADVPYDSQHTNPSGDGWRECFSSSCAMVAKYWLPEIAINDYLLRRPKYGDSTDVAAQIQTLNSFGLNARFVSYGTVEKLKAQIDRGRPAPVGWLHNGHVSSPTGGGHYSVVIGFDEHGWFHHDPNGEAALVPGGYVKTGGVCGKSINYSYKNWNPRWMVEGTGSGWGLDIWKS